MSAALPRGGSGVAIAAAVEVAGSGQNLWPGRSVVGSRLPGDGGAADHIAESPSCPLSLADDASADWAVGKSCYRVGPSPQLLDWVREFRPEVHLWALWHSE